MLTLQGKTMRMALVAVLWTLAIGSSVDCGRAQEATPRTFTPYVGCHAAGGPAVVEVAALAPGESSRTVQVVGGSRTVPLLDGRRVMFAYAGEHQYFANVKVEILPAEGWAESKAALIGEFEYILAHGDNVRNYSLKPELHGFEAHGLDREKREGGVLGNYLLFDDATHTVVTIYFLNQEPPTRFKTMEEYAVLRDQFLDGYTSCVRGSLSGANGQK
jgi:hypothetical protein